MAMIRWSDPFRELTALQERMNRIFEDTLARGDVRKDEGVYTGTWAPPVDIVETKDRLVFKVELPGFAEDQLQLRVEDGVLSIEGERRFQKEDTSESYHRVERSYGRFVRSFSLPPSVDPEKVSASFHNGLLTIEIQKREETKPKQIRIQTTSPTPLEASTKS